MTARALRARFSGGSGLADGLADAVQDERDKRQPSVSVLTGLHELPHSGADLVRRLVSDEPSGALQYVPLAHDGDLRIDLLDSPAEPAGESLAVQYGLGVAMEVDDDVPREQGAYVALDELYDRWAEHPFKIIQDFVTIPLVDAPKPPAELALSYP